MYVYLMLLGSFALTLLVFIVLYLVLYPYLAIAPPTVGGVSGGPMGPPPSLPGKLLSDLAYMLAFAFTSRPALALFYTVLLTSTFLNEFSYFPLAFYHRRTQGGRTSQGLTRFPSICVIVPAHNEEKTIETTITTLLEQSYPKKEIMSAEIIHTLSAFRNPLKADRTMLRSRTFRKLAVSTSNP